MIWGNFNCADGVHAVPITESGMVLPPHALTVTCECRPTLEWVESGSKPVVVHHDNH